MICEFCGGQTTTKKIRKNHWLHGKLYILENVEADVCIECGERYYHAEILDSIDRLLEGEHPVKDKLQVEVVNL
ncbi:MAG: YgiT-type zinc finger protein [candidate division Zixibacteria bacterium]|jgi:YgiT-type zinc finger domain-containing protein|nr:YgiT-type zinc finger protein [candidate division Zixibacteria bacterium]